jgi:endonuclease/exonuclease/phosphatase family metal-dependent hydrolase
LRILGRIITIIIAVIVTIAAIAAGYMIYLNVNSKRLPDRSELEVTNVAGGLTEGASLPTLETGREYSALTYNIGFGAYGHEFSFFMSEGRIAGGEETKGLMSRAASEDSVNSNMDAAMAVVMERRPDIAVFQEVDRNAGRSYKIDELKMISRAFGEGGSFAEAYATNFHTGWLLWPPAHPMGMVKDSGIATYSRYAIDGAERLSLPVALSFPDKFFDLDRCFTVTRMPVARADGTDAGAGSDADATNPGSDAGASGASPELVLINVHLSAYEAGKAMRDEQMKKLAGVMSEERANGNWVIAGGDWNQSFPGSIGAFTGRMETPPWVHPFDEGELPNNFSIVNADNADVIATCRDSSIPWTPGVSYETIMDGWVVSDNVTATADNTDTDYAASDHNPVLLTFTLR